MAMLPFCGYNMADYFKHWLSFKTRARHLPKIFMVNWFKKDENGQYLWPGYRENSRVIKWMIDRIKGNVSAVETPLGMLPDINDLDMSGLNMDEQHLRKLFAINPDEWKKEIEDIEKFYAQFGDRLPEELKSSLENLKAKFGC
jgi:phosphoenolpyruvate carboxykinase (GTP)